MRTRALILSLACFVVLCAEEPSLPRADDPLSKRMEGMWKGSFASAKGARFTIFRVHLGGRWQQTIVESSSGKMVTTEGGTYAPPPDRGRFLVPEDVRFSSKGRPDSIEKIKVANINELQLGDEGRMKPVIFKRIASAELPPVAALPPPGK